MFYRLSAPPQNLLLITYDDDDDGRRQRTRPAKFIIYARIVALIFILISEEFFPFDFVGAKIRYLQSPEWFYFLNFIYSTYL